MCMPCTGFSSFEFCIIFKYKKQLKVNTTNLSLKKIEIFILTMFGPIQGHKK